MSDTNRDSTIVTLEIIGLVITFLACIAAYLALIPEGKRWPFQTQATATYSVTVLLTNTPLPPTETSMPTDTPVPSTPTEAPTLSPVQTVEHYYHLLNNKEYEKAWAMFTPWFQEHQVADNIDDYIDWARQVKEVVVVDTQILEQTDTEATVLAHLLYEMQDGRTLEYANLRIYLERETADHAWLFGGIEP